MNNTHKNVDEDESNGKPLFEKLANGISKNGWLRNGQLPSLWTMARIQFSMGLLNVVMTFLTAAFAIGIIYVMNSPDSIHSNDNFLAMNITTFVWIGIAGLVFTTATAVFMLGAAITSYLARLNDRQTNEDIAHAPDSTPPAKDNILT